MLKYGREKRMGITVLLILFTIIVLIVACVSKNVISIALCLGLAIFTIVCFVLSTMHLKKISSFDFYIALDRCTVKRTEIEKNDGTTVDGTTVERRFLSFEKYGKYHLCGSSSFYNGMSRGSGYTEDVAFHSIENGDNCYVVLFAGSIRMAFPEELYYVDDKEFELVDNFFLPRKN